ncbi:MAG: multidrug MFS transporter [Micavibrio sp.]|nr:MAG: multidrug MFS transporter [Micavibrio sp.]
MIKPVIFAALAFGLTACSVGPDYTPQKTSFLDGWFAPTSEHVSNEDIALEWWSVFNDPLLENYIKKAATNNKNVQVALANVKRARALRGESNAAFFPQIDSSGSADRSKSSDAAATSGNGNIRNLYDAGFDASWELDVFGGNRRANEASDARIGSATANYQDVMLSTLAEVARSYYEARGLQKRIAITENNTKLLQETFNVVDQRLEAGEASSFDVSRARGEYQLTRARIPNLQADLHASIFTLSVLLGQPPEALLEEMGEVKPLPAPPDIVPVGLRSDMLRRRPDVRMAERELAASVADIGVETSELFPKFFITGDIGSQARVFGDVFSAAGGLWSLGSLVQWSVFEGGAIRAQIKAEEAESEGALATYEQSVLSALADAETALTRYGQELETRKRLDEGVQSRRQSVSFARELFDAGEQDYLAVLDAQRELIASENDLVISETNSITKLVALYTALGGGWEFFDNKE